MNTDVYVNGSALHVQTEDWGPDQRFLVSRVFKQGSVQKTFRLSYEKIPGAELEPQRKKALDQLHRTVIDWSYKEM